MSYPPPLGHVPPSGVPPLQQHGMPPPAMAPPAMAPPLQQQQQPQQFQPPPQPQQFQLPLGPPTSLPGMPPPLMPPPTSGVGAGAGAGAGGNFGGGPPPMPIVTTSPPTGPPPGFQMHPPPPLAAGGPAQPGMMVGSPPPVSPPGTQGLSAPYMQPPSGTTTRHNSVTSFSGSTAPIPVPGRQRHGSTSSLFDGGMVPPTPDGIFPQSPMSPPGDPFSPQFPFPPTSSSSQQQQQPGMPPAPGGPTPPPPGGQAQQFPPPLHRSVSDSFAGQIPQQQQGQPPPPAHGGSSYPASPAPPAHMQGPPTAGPTGAYPPLQPGAFAAPPVGPPNGHGAAVGGPPPLQPPLAAPGSRRQYPSMPGSQPPMPMPPNGGVGGGGSIQQPGAAPAPSRGMSRQSSATSIGQAKAIVDILQIRNIMPQHPQRPPKPPLASELARKRNCNPKIMRSTLNQVPESAALLGKSRLPFGLHVFPFGSDPVPIIRSTVITRCRVCRTYMNPFVTFLSSGRRWRCNVCLRVQDLPPDFDYDAQKREHVERSERPELNAATVEYIAPAEYMVRPPQPCVHLFLIDVSYNAVCSGMVATACETILATLDELVGDSRTKIGFITFDTQIQFYNLRATLSQPQMLVCPDIDDMFMPASRDDLLVNLGESKEMVQQLLESLPGMFASNQVTDSCFGTALLAAKELLGSVGGRILALNSTLPTLGPGALKNREDASKRGKPQEFAELISGTDFYKQFSVDASRAQIGIDMFLFNGLFADFATLSEASKFSSGTAYYYPAFHATNNSGMAEKFRREIRHVMSRPLGLEAVMRVRASRGLSVHTFHGHFFVRSQDLLALPNVSPDNGFSFQLAIEDKLGEHQPSVYFQTALLYTSSAGERRIRVHTLALPVVKSLTEVFEGADSQAIASLLAKMAVDRALKNRVSESREALSNFAVDTFSAFQKEFGSTSPGLLCPDSMKRLPIFMLSLLKNPAFRGGTTTSLDQRAHALMLLKVLPMWEIADFIYPRLYALHNMAPQMALQDENRRLPMPPLLQLSGEHISRGGLYLLTNGQELLLWVGKSLDPAIIADVFGCAVYDAIPENMTKLPRLESVMSQKVRNIISGLRNCHHRYMMLRVIKEDSKYRRLFLEYLLDDRTDYAMSYMEFLHHVHKTVKKS